MECKVWSVKCRARSVDTVKSSQRSLSGSVAFPYLVSFFLLALLHYQTKQKLPKSETLRRGPFLSIGVSFFFRSPAFVEGCIVVVFSPGSSLVFL